MERIGRPSRVDMILLQKMLDEGIPRTEIAKRLSVARSTVYAAIQRLEQESMSTDELVNNSIINTDIRKIVRQLEATNDTVHSLLTHLRACHRGSVSTELSERDIVALIIRTASEARQWARSFSEILHRLTDYGEFQTFKREIVKILVEEVSYDQRQKILRKIKELG